MKYGKYVSNVREDLFSTYSVESKRVNKAGDDGEGVVNRN